MNSSITLKTTLSKVEDPEGLLDPSDIDFVSHYYFLDNLNAKLITVDRYGNYKNELAETFNIDEENLEVFIKLKEDAKFSDQSKITATDVACSIKRLIIKGSNHTNPKNYIKGANNLTDLKSEIEGIKVQSDKELTLKLKEPVSELIDYFALADYSILHPSKCKLDDLKYKDWTKNVSGAYLLSLDDNQTSLLKNEHFILKSPKAPKRVACQGQEDINSNLHSTHYGPVPYNFYIQNMEKFQDTTLKLFGVLNASIVGLSLNEESSKFNAINRKWINKKLLESFETPAKYKKLSKKAFQFFVPRAKGFINESILLKNASSWNIDTSEIPKSLKNGIKVKTFIRTKEYIYPGLEDDLSKALGFSVSIDFDQDPKDFNKIFQDKEFDAFLIPIFMDYKIVGEALNFSFKGESSIFKDISGNIIKNLNSYQKIKDEFEKEKLIKEIILQIQEDSIAIPLFYGFSPFIYDSKINTEEINDRDLYQLWKLDVSKL